MRVLHCIPSMGGGGAERQLTYLATELTHLGWEVHVVLLHEGPNLARLQESGAVIHKLAANSNHDPRVFWQLLHTINRVQPDLIQVWLIMMEIMAGTAAQMKHIPWIFSERSSVLAYPPTFKNKMRVLMASLANAIIANSVAGDQYWQERFDNRVRRYIIPNALPLSEIETAPVVTAAQLGLEPEQQVVLFVGRFSPEKNLETLLVALKKVLTRPHTFAILCGDGPLRPQVERWLDENDLVDQVRLPGYILDIWGWMKRANVFVSVSFFEGHPNTVLEAMACGCPLVVSDIPAHREFLDEESALLVPPEDPTAIAEAIISVLAEPEAATCRAEKARVHAAQWSVPTITRRYEQVYREILAQQRQTRGSR